MASESSSESLYRKLFNRMRPYWPHLLGLWLLTLLSTPLGLLGPLPLKITVDSAIETRPLPQALERFLPGPPPHSPTAVVGFAVVLLVAVALLSQLAGLAASWLSTYTAEKLALDFRAQVFRHAQRLSISYHDARGAADGTYRVQWDSLAIQHIFLDGSIPFINSLQSLAAMVYVIARIDKQMALVALAVAPILFVLSHKYRPRLRQQSREIKRLEGKTWGQVQEVFSALRVVKAFGREDHEHDRYVRRSKEGMQARLRLAVKEGYYSLAVGLTTTVGISLVLWLGARHVRSGAMTLGDMLLVMTYLGQLYAPLTEIGKKASSLQGFMASAESAFSLLDESPDVEDHPDRRPLALCRGAVTFRDVSFGYEPARRVLEHISFEVPAGSRVGIAGRTGAGKTTLLSLLTRFYDPTSGQILLDGVDLREYRLADLRSQFALVLQDPVLFSTSIAENIAYARPEASDDEIIEAAKLANAHYFIASLPEGYRTLVGDRGMRLSGGERQRISLARAFLKDAPILLLDEPTSSVDVKTEAAIMDALERLMRGRTTFIVAHRLSTLSNCNLRIELEGGRLLAVTNGMSSRRLDERLLEVAVASAGRTELHGREI